MDYKQLAAVILEKVGGKENVDKVLHCATRLRFTLKDVDKADTDALKKTKGVLSVINAGGQYQVVIGPDVPQVYQEVVALGNFEIAKPVDAPADEPKKKQSKLSSVLEYIASMFQPIIPAITGAGLLKALMALCTVTGLLDSASQTYIILNAIADSAFYFLPILLGSSAAKTFKCNQYVAMALGGVLVYPGFVDLINAAKDAGTSVSLFGLPVTLASYSSSVVPILLGVWFMSVIEHAVQKISPKAVKFFTVPLASLLAAGVVTILALGPIGINNLATAGFDTVVGPGMLTSNVAQGAAGLAVGLRTRNKDTKQLAMSAGLTGVLGITEPVLYGVNLKFIYPLISAMIGGGVGGLYLGITGVGRYASGSPGLLVLPAYIGGDSMANLVNACIGTVIAMVVSFVVCYVLYGVWKKQGKLEEGE